MADTVVDRIVVGSDFDPAGFERGLQLMVGGVDSLQEQLTATLGDIHLPDIDTSPIQDGLENVRASLSLVTQEIDRMGDASVAPDFGELSTGVDLADEQVKLLRAEMENLARVHPDLHIDTGPLRELQVILRDIDVGVVGVGSQRDLSSLAIVAEQAEHAFRGLGVSEENLNAVLQRGGFLSTQGAAALREMGAAAGAAIPPVDGLGGAFTEAQAKAAGLRNPAPFTVETGPAQRQVTDLIGRLTDYKRTLDLVEGRAHSFDPAGFGGNFGVLAGQLQQVDRAAKGVKPATDAMIAGMTAAGVAAREEAAAVAAAAAATNGAGNAMKTLGSHGHGLKRDLREIGVGMVQVAVGAETIPASLSGVVSGIAALATAAGPIAIAAGAITLLVGAYHALTAAQREAKKAQDDIINARRQEIEGARDPGGLQKAATALTERRGLLEKEIIEAKRMQVSMEERNLSGLNYEVTVREKTKELEQVIADLKQTQIDRTKQQAEASETLFQHQKQAAEQAQQSFIQDISGLQSAGLANILYIKTAQQEMGRLLATAHDENLTMATRNTAWQQYNQLLTASESKLVRSAQLAQQEAQDRQAAFQKLGAQAAKLGAPVQLRFDILDARTQLQDQQRLLTQQINLLEREARKVGDTTAAFETLSGQARGLKTLRDSIADLLKASGAGDPLENLVASIGPLGERLALLREKFPELPKSNNQVTQTAGEVANLVNKYVLLQQAIADAGGEHRADLRLLRASSEALQKLGPDFAPYAQAVAKAKVQVRELSDATVAAGDTAFGAAVAQQLNTAADAAKQFAPALQQGMDAAAGVIQRGFGDSATAATGRLARGLKDAVGSLKETAAGSGGVTVPIFLDPAPAISAVDVMLADMQRRADEKFGLDLGKKIDKDLDNAIKNFDQFDDASAGTTDQTKALARELFNTGQVGTKAMASILSRNAALRKMLLDTRTANERLADSFRDMARVGSAIRDLAGDLDFLGESAERTIGSLTGVLSGVEALARGDVLGGVLGIGGSVLSGIFGGPSAAEQAQIDATEENSRALEEATAAYRAQTTGRFQGLGGLNDARSLLNSIISSKEGQKAIDFSDAPDSFFRKRADDHLRKAAAQFGTTQKELERIAHDYGITLIKDGRLVQGALEDLQKKLNLAAQAALGFAANVEDQTLAAGLRSQLQGVPQDPAEIFRQQLQGLRGAGASGIADLFADPSNIAAVRQQALKLLTEFENKTLDLSELGTLSREDFLRFLQNAADYLNSFGDSAAAATRHLVNIPDGFDLAAAEFEALALTAADAAREIKVPEGPRGIDLNPKVPGTLEQAAEKLREWTSGLFDPQAGAFTPLSDAAASLAAFSADQVDVTDKLAGAVEDLRDVLDRWDGEAGGIVTSRAGTVSLSRGTGVPGATGGNTVVQWSGDIVIPGQERTARELAQEVRREFEFDSMGEFGNPDTVFSS